jgi:hypothetical protein
MAGPKLLPGFIDAPVIGLWKKIVGFIFHRLHI